MLRRTQIVYISVDPFFSPRGKVLHRFDHFLEGLAEEQIPCVWISEATRAQLDEPRRRLGQNDPYIGEGGCGVYLPEDYFHLKGSQTVRLGRYTCIPVAKAQPAAAEALEELSADLGVEVVPLRKLSHRELSQNTGLPAREAELMRARDFDELFFFAGAGEEEIVRFGAEARERGLELRNAGAFWSLACGANLGKCVRELGALYDRAVRAHALRIGMRVTRMNGDQESWPATVFDRNVVLRERAERNLEARNAEPESDGDDSEDEADVLDSSEEDDANEESHAEVHDSAAVSSAGVMSRNEFLLTSPTKWEELLESFGGARNGSR